MKVIFTDFFSYGVITLVGAVLMISCESGEEVKLEKTPPQSIKINELIWTLEQAPDLSEPVYYEDAKNICSEKELRVPTLAEAESSHDELSESSIASKIRTSRPFGGFYLVPGKGGDSVKGFFWTLIGEGAGDKAIAFDGLGVAVVCVSSPDENDTEPSGTYPEKSSTTDSDASNSLDKNLKSLGFIGGWKSDCFEQNENFAIATHNVSKDGTVKIKESFYATEDCKGALYENFLEADIQIEGKHSKLENTYLVKLRLKTNKVTPLTKIAVDYFNKNKFLEYSKWQLNKAKIDSLETQVRYGLVFISSDGDYIKGRRMAGAIPENIQKISTQATTQNFAGH